jgi:AraC family transcriptional activator of pobA
MQKQSLPVFKIGNFKGNSFAEPDFYINSFAEHAANHHFIEAPHAHDFYLVLFFTKGKGTHTIEHKKYPIKRGSMFFMSPSEVHLWNTGKDTDGYVLFFNSSFYLMDTLSKEYLKLPFFRAKQKVRYLQLNEKGIKEIELVFTLIAKEYRVGSKSMLRIIRSYLDGLLYKLATFVEPELNTKEEPVAIIPGLEALIEEHFREHFPATFYAEKLNMLPEQLNHITKKYLDKTVTVLIQERLIAEAKRLLAYTSLSVSEIAYKLNFSDNSYFNRFFKKEVKLTPEQFRNSPK